MYLDRIINEKCIRIIAHKESKAEEYKLTPFFLLTFLLVVITYMILVTMYMNTDHVYVNARIKNNIYSYLQSEILN